MAMMLFRDVRYRVLKGRRDRLSRRWGRLQRSRMAPGWMQARGAAVAIMIADPSPGVGDDIVGPFDHVTLTATGDDRFHKIKIP
jgi:hypothetical protein